MMTEFEAKKVLAHLIKFPDGYDWLACNQYDPSLDAEILALKLIPKGSIEHRNLDKAVKRDLGANQIRFHWLRKSLALALDDDANGNHLTYEMLEQAKMYQASLKQKAVFQV